MHTLDTQCLLIFWTVKRPIPYVVESGGRMRRAPMRGLAIGWRRGKPRHTAGFLIYNLNAWNSSISNAPYVCFFCLGAGLCSTPAMRIGRLRAVGIAASLRHDGKPPAI